MNSETNRGRGTKQAEPWSPRLVGSAIIALAAILVGRWVFDSITGLFVAEVILGGFAGGKFRAFALPGAILAFLAWVSFEMMWNDGAFHGEGSVAFLIMFVGTTVFVISGFVVYLVTRRWGAV